MAARRWLSIVVDGSTAMAPYWRKIVSEYLVNIVRSIHYINWTNNMDQFLALLPFLSFKGHNLNHTAAEGLAEALGMFPRERMTEKEYFECERHCILVPTGEPVAERMLVPLPRVHDGKFIHGQIRILLANFLDVAKMFVPLRISLSVITPTLHPLFVSIFNEAATTTNTNGCFLPMDSYAEVMSLLNDDNNDYEEDQPRKKSKTSGPTSEEEDSLAYLFQLDPPVSLDEILGQDQTLFSNTQLGGESSQLLRDIVPQTVTRGTPSVGEGSSNGLPQQLGGNMGVVNPMFSSELNSSNSTLSLPQNNPIFWPPQTAAPFGDSTFLNTIGNSNTQFGSAARAGLPSAMVPNPLVSPVPIMSQYNQTQVLPRQPFLPDFKDSIPAWEAWRKKTSPVALTYQWSTTLEIALYLPKKAVMHTMRTYGGLLDDVLFEVTQFDNLDLYHHLISYNLCAKIALPSHTLILSTTENKHCYTASIFPGDAVFVEPL
ncbi:mediator of RNA polymerase II transcription subunit 25 [Vigna unguiculata]|uniref:Mediator of RNA polymerase II transcription subunit 25 n=1 Tax=Vigna unguiculata TaxID=3917 RepID=A0A4D6L3K3_VIGUN|nr:mediator of RNA polymerase II transcription subunit 25 [Vigna unguiculata]